MQLTECEIVDLQSRVDFAPSLDVLRDVKGMIEAERVALAE